MLIYCKPTADTGKKLAEELGMPCINGYRDTLDQRYPIIVRWGYGTGLGYIPELVINKMDAINHAVNKYKSARTFMENNIRTAPFSEAVPCIGRTRNHHQGSGFWFCWEQSQIRGAQGEGAEYFVKYIPTRQEFRIHVLGGEFAFAQKKYRDDRISTCFLGASGHRGNSFAEIYEGSDVTEDVINTGVNAVKSLKLDMGAADVIVGLDDGLAYVCEVNTGPSLPHPRVREPYINYIKQRIEGGI